jgi:hypothetical protein
MKTMFNNLDKSFGLLNVRYEYETYKILTAQEKNTDDNYC